MDVDKSGTTTHIIQKTTHMTLVSHTTSDNGAAEGMLFSVFFYCNVLIWIYFEIQILNMYATQKCCFTLILNLF